MTRLHGKNIIQITTLWFIKAISYINCTKFMQAHNHSPRLQRVHVVGTGISEMQIYTQQRVAQGAIGRGVMTHHRTSSINRNKSKSYMFLVLSCSCLCPLHSSQMLCREWRYNWSSAVRRWLNYIWMTNNCCAYWGGSYNRCLNVISK